MALHSTKTRSAVLNYRPVQCSSTVGSCTMCRCLQFFNIDASTHIQQYVTHVGVGCFHPCAVRMAAPCGRKNDVQTRMHRSGKSFPMKSLKPMVTSNALASTWPEPQDTPLDALDHTMVHKGHAVLNPSAVSLWAGCQPRELDALMPFWDHMPLDAHLKDGGSYRRRRHSCFEFRNQGSQLFQIVLF